MRIDIISVLPTMMEGFFQESILARAQKKGLVDIQLHNLRDYSTDKWRRVDDYPYGGSAGMVMQCEPIDRCISALQAQRHYDEVIYMSPMVKPSISTSPTSSHSKETSSCFAVITKALTSAYASTSSHANSALATMCSREANCCRRHHRCHCEAHPR